MTKRTKKKYNYFLNILVLLVILITTTAQAQDWAKSLINNLQRVDLRNLGYPMVNEIPENSSAITSLILGKDDKIYGGTS